jgi:hypothetical protein
MNREQLSVNYQGRTVLTWTIRDDVTPDEVKESKEHEKVGIRGFDFNKPSVKTGPRKNLSRPNFLELIIHLWSGDRQAQLKQLNVRIRLDKEIKRRCQRGAGARAKTVREIFEKEFTQSEFQ